MVERDTTRDKLTKTGQALLKAKKDKRNAMAALKRIRATATDTFRKLNEPGAQDVEDAISLVSGSGEEDNNEQSRRQTPARSARRTVLGLR